MTQQNRIKNPTVSWDFLVMLDRLAQNLVEQVVVRSL